MLIFYISNRGMLRTSIATEFIITKSKLLICDQTHINENNIKVPKQFSIVGFDDMPIARYLIPKLTTIRYPIDLMANYAAKLALSLVDSSIVTPTVVQFNPTLVRRFSVENAIKP